MTIRRRLLALSALVLVPALLCAALGLYGWYREKVQRDAENVLDIARVLTAAIERELSLRAAILEALSLSPALARGDLAAFRELAIAAAPRGKARIVITNTAGRHILASPPLPPGEPAIAALPAAGEAPGAGTAMLTDLYSTGRHDRYAFAVQVPVLRNGRTAYFLTSEIAADVLQRWLEAGKLRAGWTAAILDRSGNMMACTMQPRTCIGQAADESLRAQLSRGETLTETRAFRGERRSPQSCPWARAGGPWWSPCRRPRSTRP